MIFPEVQINDITVQVSIDTGGVATFRYLLSGLPVQPPLVINVPANTQALIRLVIEPPPSQALFLTNPVNWFGMLDLEQPVPTAANITVVRDTDKLCTILDYNEGKDETFHGRISVIIDGTVYTSPDPTIINHKPG
jgi:hypothetical protein